MERSAVDVVVAFNEANRNVFETIDVLADGDVVATGRSVCAFDALDGPARWHASVADGLVTTWRVEDPLEQS